MDLFNVMAGGAMFGVITACWGYIKAAGWKLASLLIQRVEIQSEQLANEVLSYLVENLDRSKVYDRTYSATYECFRSRGLHGWVSYEEIVGHAVVFWRGWFPVVASRAGKKTGTEPGGVGDNENQPLVLTFLRHSFDIDACVGASVRVANERAWEYRTAPEAQERRYFVKYLPEFDKDDNKRTTNRHYRNGLPWYHSRRYRLVGCAPSDLGPPDPVYESALAQLVFPAAVNELIEEVRLWRNNRDWYVRRGIPWKRGWLLYGPPGTGKTALARALAEDLDLPIFVYSLADMSNFSLMRNWTEMRASTPCIALFEDIDNVFHGRSNVSGGLRRDYFGLLKLDTTQKAEQGNAGQQPAKSDRGPGAGNDLYDIGRVSFDCFLNVLDGVERNDGVFVIMTTNDLSKIDPALGQPRRRPDGGVELISTRPGRIDRAIELGAMTQECKRTLARRILGEYPEALATIFAHVDANPELSETPAQFQERCSQVALQCFWEQQKLRAVAAPDEAEATDVTPRPRLTVVDRRDGDLVPAGDAAGR